MIDVGMTLQQASVLMLANIPSLAVIGWGLLTNRDAVRSVETHVSSPHTISAGLGYICEHKNARLL